MKKVFTAITISALSLCAQAYEFNFTAEVTYTDQSLSNVTIGTLFEGHFQATGAFNSNEQLNILNVADYSFATGYITAQINGHTVTAEHPTINIYDNLGGNVEDGFSLHGGYPLAIDGVTLPSGSLSFNLTSKPGNTGVINGLSLPMSINVSDFDGNDTLNYGVLQRDGGQHGTILGFKVINVEVAAVPEPNAPLMALLSASAIVALRRRKST